MSSVLAVVNGKGWVGKTTTAVNLGALLSEGRRVLLVDANPQEAGSAAWWLDRATGETPFDVAKETDIGPLARLRQVDDYEIVVVATPPRLDSAALRAVVRVANLTVCPSPPAVLDGRPGPDDQGSRPTINPRRAAHRAVGVEQLRGRPPTGSAVGCATRRNRHRRSV